jgi:hypothetical protein
MHRQVSHQHSLPVSSISQSKIECLNTIASTPARLVIKNERDVSRQPTTIISCSSPLSSKHEVNTSYWVPASHVPVVHLDTQK